MVAAWGHLGPSGSLTDVTCNEQHLPLMDNRAFKAFVCVCVHALFLCLMLLTLSGLHQFVNAPLVAPDFNVCDG